MYRQEYYGMLVLYSGQKCKQKPEEEYKYLIERYG
jgi:hypothetical protein